MFSQKQKDKQQTKQRKQYTPKGGFFNKEVSEFSKWHTHVEKSKGLGLQTTLTLAEWEAIVDAFGNRCAVSFSFNHSLEHFIPQSVGGGTTKENCYPMDLDLNISKNNTHPFHWFEANKERIDNALWDELIAYLADLNGMDALQYRRYVDWCFEHRRCNREAFLADDRRTQTERQLYQCMKEMFDLSDKGMSDYVEWCYQNKYLIGCSSLQQWIYE